MVTLKSGIKDVISVDAMVNGSDYKKKPCLNLGNIFSFFKF